MARIQLEPPGPTESCRPDYGTWTFKLDDEMACIELVDLANNLGHHVAPAGYMDEPKQGKHAAEVRSHCSGISVELTHPDSPRRNAGLGIISIPGQVFAALDAQERLQLYRDIRTWRGYYRCTRLDVQLTVLNPPVTAAEFCDLVADGMIWPKHFSSSMPYGEKDRSGNWRSSPTQYFGTPESPTRVRVYRHGVKLGWDVEDLRFEVQQRKRNADDTFRSMCRYTQKEATDLPLLLVKEPTFVKNVLMEKLDLRDTSQIDRQEIGGKWLRKAPPVDWYFDLVNAPEAPVERTARPQPSLAQSVRAGVDQYGGNGGAYLLRVMATEGATLKQASEAVGMRCIGKMTDQHRARAKEGLTPAQQAKVDRLYAKLTNEAAQLAEVFWTD